MTQNDTNNVAAELDQAVSTFDAERAEREAREDREVAARGFTVRRGKDQTTVTHNRTDRTFTFCRDSETFVWSANTGNFGDTHRNGGERTFEFHDRVVAANSEWQNDVEARAVRWFREANARGEAFRQENGA